jgi:hypothetical protein
MTYAGGDLLGEQVATNVLGMEDGGWFGTDRTEKFNQFTSYVGKVGVSGLVSQAVDMKLRELGRGDLEMNAAVFTGELGFEVLAAAATGGESVLLRGANTLYKAGRIGGTAGEIIYASGKVLEGVHSGTRMAMKGAGTAFKPFSEMAGLSRAVVNVLPGARTVNQFGDAVADITGSAYNMTRAAASKLIHGKNLITAAEVNAMSKVTTALRNADRLMEEAVKLGANSRKAQSFARESMAIRQGVVDFSKVNPELMAKFENTGSTAQALARLQNPDAVRNASSLMRPGGKVVPPVPVSQTNKVANSLNTVRNVALDNRLNGALAKLTLPTGINPATAARDLSRTMNSLGVPDTALRTAAGRGVQRLNGELKDLKAHRTTMEVLAKQFKGEDGAVIRKSIESTREMENKLKGQQSLLAALERAPPAGKPKIDAPIAFDKAASQSQVGTRLGKKASQVDSNLNRVAIERRYTNEAIPNERFASASGPGAVDLNSRKAEGIAAGLRREAEKLHKKGDLEKAARYEDVAKLADERVEKLRPADFEYGLSKSPGLREKMLGHPGLAKSNARAEGAARVIANDPAARKAVAEFLEDTPNWELMSKRLPQDDPALAAQMEDFREWMWSQVEQKFPGKVQRTGTRGQMGNDLDFSVTGSDAGRTQLAVEKFLREELEIAPGVRGLGKNWEQKMHSTAFSDGSLIHVYDRLANKAAAGKIRDDMFEFVEAAQLARVKHNMEPAEWARFKATLDGVDAEKLIAKYPIDASLTRADMLLKRDEAFARLDKSGFTDAAAAHEVSKLQVMINRRDPEAYLSFGGVKQTVTYKEGLVAFDRPLLARVENGRIAIHPRTGGDGSPGLMVEFPGGTSTNQVFSNVRELKAHLKSLNDLPSSIQNNANKMMGRRLMNDLEDTLLRLDPSERYQSILGNIAFYNHQLEEAGYNGLKALRRYQSSKYLDRVLDDAISMGMDAKAYSFLGEAKSLAHRFYKERDPLIGKYFGAETSPFTAAQHAQLESEAMALVEKIGELNAKIAARARKEATHAISRAKPNSFVPVSENPSGFLNRTFGHAGQPAGKAFRNVERNLGDNLDGIIGDFSSWRQTGFRYPSEIKTPADARLFSDMPRGLPQKAIDTLTPEQLRIYQLKSRTPVSPAALEVAVKGSPDPSKLALIQKNAIEETGVLVKFVKRDSAGKASSIKLPGSRGPPVSSKLRAGAGKSSGPTNNPPIYGPLPRRPAKALRGSPEAAGLQIQTDVFVDEIRKSFDDLKKSFDPAKTQRGDLTLAQLESRARQAKEIEFLQHELEATIKSSRNLGMPEDHILWALGNPTLYKTAPSLARKNAILGLHEAHLRNSGTLLPDDMFDEIRSLSTKIFTKTANPKDVARFGEIVNQAAKGRVDFFDNAPMGRFDWDSGGFVPVLSREETAALQYFAIEKGIVTPSLKGTPIRGAPIKSHGTPGQIFPDNCGGVLGMGMACDTSRIKAGLAPSQAVQRQHLIDKGLLAPLKDDINAAGMTNVQLRDWLNEAGADAHIMQTISPEWVQYELGMKNQIGALIKVPGVEDGLHWVRIEASVISPYDGKLWYSIGDSAAEGMSSWRVPAEIFHTQMVSGVVADWARMEASLLTKGAGKIPDLKPVVRKPRADGIDSPPGPSPAGAGIKKKSSSSGRLPESQKEAAAILNRLVKGDKSLAKIDRGKALNYIQSNTQDGISPAQLAVEAVQMQGGRVSPKKLQSVANISDRKKANATVTNAGMKVKKNQKAEAKEAARQENLEIEKVLARRAKNKQSDKVAEAIENARIAKEVEARRATSPEIDMTGYEALHGPAIPVERFKNVPTHQLVTGDTDTLSEIMKGMNYYPIQNDVQAHKINDIVRRILYEPNELWGENVLANNLIKIGPEGQIVHGHHRMVAAVWIHKRTGRPIFGSPESNPIIPDANWTKPWDGPKPEPKEPPIAKRGGWRIKVEE